MSADSPFMVPRRLPRERYAEMGRRGGQVTQQRRQARLELAGAPSVRAVVKRSDARRGAVDAYARALVELHQARDFAEDAYWRGETSAIRRALRWVAAANAVADRCHDELLAFS